MPEPRTYYTLVVCFDGEPPSVRAEQPILGGALVGVQFNDALYEIEGLRTALRRIAEGGMSRGEIVDTAITALFDPTQPNDA